MKYELLLLELLKLLKQTLPCRPRNRQLCKKKNRNQPIQMGESGWAVTVAVCW